MATLMQFKGIPAYIVGENKPETPVVIVIQEFWGITDDIQNQAKILNEKGYFCVIPDLYKGNSTMEMEEARHQYEKLNFIEAAKEMDTIIGELRSTNPNRKVGATGFCMGGALTLILATIAENKLNAAAPFYGISKEEHCDLTKIQAPVLAHFGDLDHAKGFSDPPTVDLLEEKLKKAGIEYTIERIKTQGHGYMNGADWSKEKRAKQGIPHDEKIVAESYERLFAFFEKHLRN